MSGPRYSIFPAECLNDPCFKDVHLRVLAMIGTHTDNRGWCEVNQRKLGEASGKSRETINRAIRDLCEMGYLSKRDRQTKAGGRTISQYRVLMDRPDDAQDVDGAVTSVSQGAVTSGDHSPCDEATSQLNDPSFNDRSSLRSDRERVVFDDLWDAFPQNPYSKKLDALTEFNALSETDQHAALAGAQHFAAWFREEAGRRKEPLADRLSFAPSLARWLRERGWVQAMTLKVKAKPNSEAAKALENVEYVDRVSQPELFEACERIRGKAPPASIQRFAFDKAIVEQARSELQVPA